VLHIEETVTWAQTATGGIERPLITIEPGHLHRLASQAEAALAAANVDIYSRGGELVRPIIDEVDASKDRKTKTARLRQMNTESMIDYCSRYITR